MKRIDHAVASAVEHTSEPLFDKGMEHATAVLLEPVRWLTTSEAARYLRVSISALKTMIYRGQVRVHKLGRRNRFLREELDRLITAPLYR